jgi:acyl-CoA dehydrogenase
MAKYYASEKAIELSSDGLQVFGGAGYTEEYDAAKIYRDARITNIYEGTTQLQVVAAIGGVVEGMSEKGILRNYLAELRDKTPEEAKLPELEQGVAKLEQALAKYKEFEREQKDYHAFDIVEMATHLVNLHIMCEIVGKAEGDMRDKRLDLAQAYAHSCNAVWAADLAKLD